MKTYVVKAGAPGAPGVPILWQGSFNAAPLNPQLDWAFRNTVVGISYIWDGAFWKEMNHDGMDGQNAYLYVAYASDDTGTDWNLTPDVSLKYRAEIQSMTPLKPVEADFSGATWVKYLGANGTNGIDGSGYYELGIWVEGVDYNGEPNTDRDIVLGSDGNKYLCYSSHTSTTDDEPITGVNWVDDWQLFITNGSDGLNADMTRQSTDSIALALGNTGHILFTAAGLNLGWGLGTRLRMVSVANPTKFQEGIINHFTTTMVRLDVDLVNGSGTYDDWNISIAGERGSAGPAQDLKPYVKLAGLAGGQDVSGGTGASQNLTLRSTFHAAKGSIEIGSTTAGENVNINATLGAELAPALTGNSGTNWTLSNTTGYTQPFAGTIAKTGDGAGTITPTAATAIVSGSTYKVVIVVDSISVSSLLVTVGASIVKNITAAGTYTIYVTASSTANILLTPILTGLRFVISSISMKLLSSGIETIGKQINFGSSAIYGNLSVGANCYGGDGISGTVPIIEISSYNLVSTVRRIFNGTGGSLDGITGLASGYFLCTETPNDMVDGFGGGIVLGIRDITGVDNISCRIYGRRDGADNLGCMQFFTIGASAGLPTMTLRSSGNVGIGLTAPTAILHLKAGKATVGTAPLKIDAGVLNTVTEVGAIESDGTHLYWVNSLGVRKQLDN